jgi:hypothetical protein
VHARDTSLSDLGGKHRAKPIPPKRHGLVADVDPALSQQIHDIAQREWYLTYIITTSRMTSGELLKQRNGLLMPAKLTAPDCPRIALTEPERGFPSEVAATGLLVGFTCPPVRGYDPAPPSRRRRRLSGTAWIGGCLKCLLSDRANAARQPRAEGDWNQRLPPRPACHVLAICKRTPLHSFNRG